MAAAAPRVVLGTWTFGGQTPRAEAERQLDLLAGSRAARVPAGGVGAQAAGQVLVDTAIIYQDGASETMLGDILRDRPDLRDAVSIATKANATFRKQGLGRQSITMQCDESLRRLQVPAVDLYYLHWPDIDTAVDETVDGIAELVRAGKVREWGLSNYPAWQVVHIHHRCRERGVPAPTVYQGMYNAITRSVEPELLPALRATGMRGYFYNPLAGGLLTGKYRSPDAARGGGRFDDAVFGKQLVAVYEARFWKVSTFAALDIIRAACAAAGVAMGDAALRWLMHHSQLSPGDGDGVILGASSAAHAAANIRACAMGPLPAEVVAAMDAAWAAARPDCEGYFRGYAAAPGASDDLLRRLRARAADRSRL